jgi:WD40 repeat protein
MDQAYFTLIFPQNNVLCMIPDIPYTRITCIAFINNDTAVVGGENRSQIIDLSTKTKKDFPQPISFISSYPAENLVAITNKHELKILKYTKKKEFKTIWKQKNNLLHKKIPQEPYANKPIFTPQDNILITFQYKNGLVLHDYKKNKSHTIPLAADKISTRFCASSCYPSSAAIFLYKGNANTAYLVEAGKKTITPKQQFIPKKMIRNMSLSPNHEYCAMVFSDGSCRAIEISTGKQQILRKRTLLYSEGSAFYTNTVVAILICPSSLLSGYHIEYWDVMAEKIIDHTPFGGTINTHYSFEKCLVDIVFSPDFSLCMILHNDEVFIMKISDKVRLFHPQAKKFVLYKFLLLHGTRLIPDIIHLIGKFFLLEMMK